MLAADGNTKGDRAEGTARRVGREERGRATELPGQSGSAFFLSRCARRLKAGSEGEARLLYKVRERNLACMPAAAGLPLIPSSSHRTAHNEGSPAGPRRGGALLQGARAAAQSHPFAHFDEAWRESRPGLDGGVASNFPCPRC